MSMDTPITSSHPALMILSRSCILTIVEIITDCIINSCFSKKKKLKVTSTDHPRYIFKSLIATYILQGLNMSMNYNKLCMNIKYFQINLLIANKKFV